MPTHSDPVDVLAVSADATRLSLELMRLVRLGTPYSAGELRAAAALSLSLGEPLAHFLADAPAD